MAAETFYVGQVIELCDLGVLNGCEANGDYGDLTVRLVYRDDDGHQWVSVIDSTYGREWDGPSVIVADARDAL